MSTLRASDHFDSEVEFQAMLDDAEENAKTDGEVKFVDSLNMKVQEYGIEAFLSDSQYEWLKQIAER
jgi:hypothetical protein